MASSKLLLTAEEQGVLSDDAEESKALPRRGRGDDWYQERCVFCAGCKRPVRAAPLDKRGSRCTGCRRWFHSACLPASGSQPQSADAAAPGDQHPAEKQQHHHHSSRLFFHSQECSEVYHRLAALAAAGEQQLPPPASKGVAGFWQQKQQQQAPPPETWRLLDLSEVRQLYRDAQRRGGLLRQHQRVAAQLAADEQQQESMRGRGGGSGSGPQAQQQQPEAVATALPTRLDDFLAVAELLQPLGESAKDLLDDSFGVVTRSKSGGAATCAATFNIFAGDGHARLQGLATPAWRARQGHATALLRQLESVLLDAGLQQLVVILEPQDGESGSGPQVERWMRRRLGFVPVSSEQAMLWRAELPEYHKQLMAGCKLLVKPLAKPKPRGWLW